MSVNATAIGCISNLRSIKFLKCNESILRISKWGNQNKLWLLVAHVLIKKTVEADTMSRKFRNATEWKLNQRIFAMVTQQLERPRTDMFAYHSHKKLDKHVL